MSPRKTRPIPPGRILATTLAMAPDPDAEPIVIRHSEIADFRHCPLKHRWAWRDGWYSPARESGGARELGSIWHEMLKIRYRYIQARQLDGRPMREEDLDEQVGRQVATANTDLQETLVWMYEGYIEKHGWDPDWKIVSVELEEQARFNDEDGQPLVIDGRPVFYSWMTDILVASREYRGILVVDTKSTGQPMSQMDIDLSDQFGLYTLGWQRLGKKVRGQLVNMAHTKKLKRAMTLDERFVRRPSIRTATELRNIELDAVDTIYEIWSARNQRRSRSHPDPRTCGWKCDFKEPHLRLRREKDPEGRTEAIMRRFGMQTGATHGR